MWQHLHLNPSVARTRWWTVCLLCTPLWLVFCKPLAWGHKVMIFAWVEGDTVYTQSKFSGGKRAKNSTVVVYDNEGNQLLEGKTDEKGEFSFKVPQKTDLKIVLKASMGHMGEWKIAGEEITAVADAREGSTPEIGVEAGSPEAAPSTETKTKPSGEQPLSTAVGLSRQEVRDLIDESLDKKLGPILDMLADSLDRGPGVSEVVGGVGYIFGLVGVALYFATRRRSN